MKINRVINVSKFSEENLFEREKKKFKFEFFFLLAFAGLPLAIIDASLVSYLDVKMCILMLLSGFCSLHLLINNKDIKFNNYILLLGIYAILRVSMLIEIHNPGFYMYQISLALSSVIIAIWIVNSSITASQIAFSTVPAVLACLICSFSMYFFRSSLLSSYSPFGAPIGLKNSLSVYLGQVIPFLLLSMLELKRSTKFVRVIKIALWFLITFSLWVVITNRTRSAWWMLAVLFIVLLIYKFRNNKSEDSNITWIYGSCLSLAIVLTTFVPNSLIWRSSSPYLESLKTMIDPSNSNGRLELWRVALEIVKNNPFFGIGTGNYPVLWQDFISSSTVKPTVFAFLRPDLPLFNDYLQAVVENGLFVGTLFLGLFLIYPLFFIFKKSENLSSLLLAAVGLLTSIDAFFDYPLNRPESLLVFVVAISLLLRGCSKIQNLHPRYTALLFLCTFVFANFQAIRLGVALYSRRQFDRTQNIIYLKSAWQAWPWDVQWDSAKIEAFLTNGEFGFAEKIAIKRAEYFPNDAQSYYMLALVSEFKGDVQEAENYLKKALYQVQGGGEYPPAMQKYLKYQEKNKIN